MIRQTNSHLVALTHYRSNAMKLKKSSLFYIIALSAFVFSCRKDKPIDEYIPPFELQEGQSNWTKMPYDSIEEYSGNQNGGNARSFWFFDAQHGFMISSYTHNVYYGSVSLHETWDGGNNWELKGAVHHSESTTNWNCDLGFFNSASGILTWSTSPLGTPGFSPYSGMSKSNDGGSTWSATSIQGQRKLFIIDENCAIVGNRTTKDGGASWQTKSIPGQPADIFFKDTTFGLMASFQIISKSTDFAASWDTVYYDGGANFEALTMTDANVIFAGGNSGILKSVDEGSTWTNVFDNYNVIDIAFADDLVGFATAFDLSTNKGYVLKTTDGGNTWVENYHSNFLIPTCLFVANSTTIYAGCSQKSDINLKHMYFLKTTTQGN